MLQICLQSSFQTGLLLPGISVFLLQFQLHRHYDQVVVTVDICSRKLSALSSVDTGLESPWCENIVNLVVCDAIRRMPRSSSGDLVRNVDLRY